MFVTSIYHYIVLAGAGNVIAGRGLQATLGLARAPFFVVLDKDFATKSH